MQTPDASAFQLQAQGNPWYGLFQGLAQGAINFGQTWSAMTNAQTNKDVGNSQIGLNNANTQMTLLNKDWAPKLWESDIKEKQSRIALNETENKFQTETAQIRKDLLSASLVGMQLQNKHQQILNLYLPFEKQLSLGLQVQQLSNMVATERLTYAQATESLTRSLLNEANANLADYIRTSLAQNSYERSIALAGEVEADLKTKKAKWQRDYYYDGPLKGLYHTLDKMKSYISIFGE